MTMREHREDILRALCARVEEEDGISPARERRPREEGKGGGRKDRQFCKQVVRALNLAVMAESSSPFLRELVFVSAEPAPDTSRLRVNTQGEAAIARAGAAAVLAELRRATGFLRSQVAAAISRRRVPELTFVLIAPSGKEVGDEA